MKKPVEELRLFSKPDDEVLEQSDNLLSSFQENKPKFVERFPQLADPFDTEWAAATATAREILPDYTAVAGQTSETVMLESMMEQGRNLFQTVILYVELAFAEDATTIKLFGKSQYNLARNSHLKLPVLLKSTFKLASDSMYMPALLEKGLKESEIALLKEVADNIIKQNQAQKDAIKSRALITSQRIAAMNAVWEKMALVCQCAKLVFQDDAAKYNLFQLTDSAAPKTEEKTTPTDGTKQ